MLSLRDWSMKLNIKDVLDIARAEIGYIEKATNSMLDDKTANAGANNFTKYGKARGCNGQPWCDAFVDWCFIKAYGEECAKRLLCGFSNYTPTSAQYFKDKGLFATTKPCVGDVVFFKNSSRICHTGIVVDVDNFKIKTIEGNTSSKGFDANGGGVFEKTYLLPNARIAGYGRPYYDETKVHILYKGCIGASVKEMQQRLNEKFAHNKIVVDGDFGNNTFNKLVEAQAIWGMNKDGICDERVWSALK